MTYDNEPGSSGTLSVSAMFDSQAEAQRAVERLSQAGISSERIRQVAGGSDTASRAGTVEDRNKGFWDGLEDFFFPDEDRYSYAEGLSRGGYLVTVTGLSGADYETALDILDDEGSINLEEREESWRSEGWSDYQSSSYGASAGDLRGRAGSMTDNSLTDASDASMDASDYQSDDASIPVVEERIRIGKRETAHGRVRVRAYTVEEPVRESVDLREERVEVERRPVDRPLTDADAAFQDRTIEAEEYREEAVVQKEARVVEEIELRKTSETHRETVSDTVRRTEVEIEDDRDGPNRQGLDPEAGTRDYDSRKP
ncbi:hypothetical protein GCM10011402_35850 [Paracoccus acridae]|uniref:DUF2382 domain-containing protein n=1 Tax=Paracoccus acridae TaxID=1795310 RepID=A0ABQ1VM16_9RHOB|nr:DUF2382 domain-containing protein [Paracoccus acridae]GGF80049.1 hypothetical protein GCM10011402_35850 [Paracoccus acridae]